MRDKIKEIFIKFGAEVCRIANIDLFGNDIVNCSKYRTICKVAFGKK